MLAVFHNSMTVIAVLYFICWYKNLKGYSIGFSLYFVIAMFPYKFVVESMDLLDYVLKILILLELLMLLKKRTQRLKVLWYPIVMIVLIFLSGLVASIYSTLFNEGVFLKGLANISYIFLVIWLLYNRVKTQDGIQTVFGCLCRNSVILCFFALIERFVFAQPRVELYMSNPNYLAFYLGLTLCLALYFNRYRYLIPVLLLGLYLTKSGSVMLGLLLCCVIWALSLIVSRRYLIKFVMIIIPMIPIAGILVIGLGSYTNYSLIMRLIEWKDSARIGIWTEGLRDFLEHPIFGYGYYCWREQVTEHMYVTHNDFLRIMVDLGITGLVTFAAGWIIITKRILKSQNAMLYLYMISVITMFSCFHNNLNSYMTWLFFCLVIFDKYITRKEKTSDTILIKSCVSHGYTLGKG